jgi:hypothetical protein
MHVVVHPHVQRARVGIRKLRVSRAVVDGFAQVLLAPPELAVEAAVVAEPVIEVEFGGRARVRIPASFPAELAAAVVKALSRR